MPRTFLVDFISVTDEVIKLARKVVAGDWTNEQVQEWQYRRYSEIRTATDKDDWAPTDREFGALQLIETKLAASDIIEHYGDMNTIPIVQAMREGVMLDLKGILSYMTTSATAAAGQIVSTTAKSWNLNKELRPPNRLRNIDGTEGKGSRPLNWEPDF